VEVNECKWFKRKLHFSFQVCVLKEEIQEKRKSNLDVSVSKQTASPTSIWMKQWPSSGTKPNDIQ